MGLGMFAGLIVAVIALIAYYFKKKFAYWEDLGFDFVKPEFPLGNMKGVGTKAHMAIKCVEFYEAFKNKAKVIGLYMTTSPTLLVTNLNTLHHIMIKDFNSFHDRGMYVNKKVDPLSAHLVALEGMEWKGMRAKLTPTFTSGKMKMMFVTVLDISREMVSFLNGSERPVEIEMKDILACFTTDVIGSVAFGLEMNSMKNPDSMFRKMGRKVFETPLPKLLKLIILTNFKAFGKKFNIMFHEKDVADFFLESIKDTVEYREQNKIQRNDFLSLLIQLKNNGRLADSGVASGDATEKISLNELSAQAFVFFLAGFETSSTTQTFALYELARNPDIQEKLRQDIRSVIAKHNNELTYEAMNEMKYLQMVIDETLRKYPPVDLIRTSSKDFKVPDTKLEVPKGMMVFIPVYAIHNDPDIYPEPEKFDPERFNDENKKSRHPMAYIPFGDGPRSCIGLRFGLMQTKIGLIQLLSNFKFSPGAKTTIPMEFMPSAQILSPINDMWLKVEKL